MNFLFSVSVLQWSCKEDSRGRGKSGDPHPSRNWYWHYWYRNKSRLSCEGTYIENIINYHLFKISWRFFFELHWINKFSSPWKFRKMGGVKIRFCWWVLIIRLYLTPWLKIMNALHELVTQVIFCSYSYLSVACVASKLKNILNFILLK